MQFPIGREDAIAARTGNNAVMTIVDWRVMYAATTTEASTR